MLVLSRYENESIVIGDGEDAIEVVVVEVRGNKVRLGVHCAKQIPVNRSEIAKSKGLTVPARERNRDRDIGDRSS